jgi:hypothetical protein
MTYDANKFDGWHDIICTKRFKIAWCSMKYWTQYGAYKHSWFFSFRDRMGFAQSINKFGYWYQLCIFGLNIGFIYKLQ